ncbi:MAG: radical SAM protein [candidate division KSB1 bacterium]|nr:radical SAM protein [candidate division KSB1 bacterium]MDZ7341035.1 radical SAM protein [candidate division KSB1 bacterium]
MFKPAYLALYQSGELQRRIDQLTAILARCTLCPRQCQVNRLQGELGICRAGRDLTIASFFPHFGEEAPLVGHYGSGTIFLTHCNLRCSFCQNYDISHLGAGEEMSTRQLAQVMIYLQKQGCHNINFVTPTHYAPQIMAALPLAIELGLEVPLVYNCGGYEALTVIQLLDGIIDIYMPDIKFSSTKFADEYAHAANYFEIARRVLREMQRQVGVLQMDARGLAYRGLLIRHLVMPNDVSGTAEILRFIADEISLDSYVNIMAQYHPCFQAQDDPLINRRITSQEYHQAIAIAKKYGLHRGF